MQFHIPKYVYIWHDIQPLAVTKHKKVSRSIAYDIVYHVQYEPCICTYIYTHMLPPHTYLFGVLICSWSSCAYALATAV